jgi:hypothetical protein
MLWLLACIMRGATILLPAQPAAEEIRAAGELGRVWLRGTGGKAEIRSENAQAVSGETGPWFFVGETELAGKKTGLPVGLDADGFRVAALSGDRVVLCGASPGGTELAVGWFAQHVWGVRWFWPGAVGEEVPSLLGWRPAAFDWTIAPAFLSRSLETDPAWMRHNGLHARLPHGHALFNIFPGQLFERHREWFPLLEGSRYRPESTEDHSWQPNLALPEVAEHAAEVADAFFDREPRAEGFSLSENDSIRFDQSEATRQARGPLRWFRGRPDYSDLVFGFVNRVAEEVAWEHPDKLLSAYAYYWCENVPTFPVRPNVVPWLTADRSQYYDERFAQEDRALIERWCRSGAKVVGIYDYLYGAPFLVPRATTRMTAESIQFAYQAGVRAYTAETSPHWAFDGPKLWVAAQLLWDPKQSVDALLDEYYDRFWKEAAKPMRRFDEACEKAWRSQPEPAWWLKYYNDEGQARLFPLGLRRELRADIEEARADAKNPEIRERVAVVSAAFSAVERFVEFCEARNALSDAAAGKVFGKRAGLALLKDYLDRRVAFVPAFGWAVAMHGMTGLDLEPYLRNDPAPRAAATLLAETEAGAERREMSERLAVMAGDRGSAGLTALLQTEGDGDAAVRLLDPQWATLAVPAILDDRTLRWSRGPWQARGEPVEGRSIRMFTEMTGQRVIRFEHDKAESLFQWIPAVSGKTYRAEVKFRGRVSPGNESFIILNWLDHQHRYVGHVVADQVPPGDWSQGRSLLLVEQAPKDAILLGVGLHVYNQTGGDFAEFAQLRLAMRVEKKLTQ